MSQDSVDAISISEKKLTQRRRVAGGHVGEQGVIASEFEGAPTSERQKFSVETMNGHRDSCQVVSSQSETKDRVLTTG